MTATEAEPIDSRRPASELTLGPHGLRLLKEFEAEKGGKPAMEAYLDPVGIWTLGYGFTQWPHGDVVKPGDKIKTDAELDAWLAFETGRFARHVQRYVTVPVEQHEFDALVCLAYNIGQQNLLTSSVLRKLNAGSRRDDVATAFQMQIGGTVRTPSRRHITDPGFTQIIGAKEGKPCWVGPDGEPCSYFTRLRGLLRRRHAEACLFLGFDWVEAVRSDAIQLRLTPIHETIARGWNAQLRRWEDAVVSKTDLSEVLSVARKYPLPELPPVALPPADFPFAVDDVELDPVAPDIQLPEFEIEPEVHLPPLPPPVAPAPPVGTRLPDPDTKPIKDIPYRVDPDLGAKPMERSERFIGAVLTAVGVFLKTLMARGFAATGFLGVATTWFLEMISKPATAAMMTAAILMGVTGACYVGGQILLAFGRKIKRRGEIEATQVLY